MFGAGPPGRSGGGGRGPSGPAARGDPAADDGAPAQRRTDAAVPPPCPRCELTKNQFNRTIQNYQRAYRKKIDGLKADLRTSKDKGQALQIKVNALSAWSRVHAPSVAAGVVLGVLAGKLLATPLLKLLRLGGGGGGAKRATSVDESGQEEGGVGGAKVEGAGGSCCGGKPLQQAGTAGTAEVPASRSNTSETAGARDVPSFEQAAAAAAAAGGSSGAGNFSSAASAKPDAAPAAADGGAGSRDVPSMAAAAAAAEAAASEKAEEMESGSTGKKSSDEFEVVEQQQRQQEGDREVPSLEQAAKAAAGQ